MLSIDQKFKEGVCLEKNSSKNTSLIKRDKKIRQITWVGLVLNTALSAAKILAGIMCKSQALTADGIHSLSDAVTDVAVIAGSFFWSKPPDTNHQYGHQRLETLITFFISIVLLTAGAGIGWKAVITIRDVHATSPSAIALFIAAVSIFSKEFLYRWNIKAGKRLKSMSLIANAWHHRLDSLSSIPVFFALGGAVIFPDWTFLDHIGAIFVSALIFHTGLKIMFQSINEFIDIGAPEKIREEIKTIVSQNSSVSRVYGIKTRYMGSSLQVGLNLVLERDIPVFKAFEISEQIRTKLLNDGPDIIDVWIQIEPEKKQ